ncbi:hypothetical protein BT96DRAFT_1024045 [Gymnopus androsaceus JB14]|uniref:CHAT domain-containing protein n=1 Tax=Gymnopus androsaceus JB14 TaxID=1447944 RepID=A0A6A4H0E0_9AGAR|nr:hypothetical protein BT96DRAFT_1024045 [Gymnopus androsaceus JB14]
MYKMSAHYSPTAVPKSNGDSKPNDYSGSVKELQDRFQLQHLTEHLNEIEKAIASNQQAVNVTSRGHADRPRLLNNLADALQSRFNHLRSMDDLNSAIAIKWEAVDTIPNDQVDLKSTWFDLGNAIVAIQQAVDLIPDNHTNKPVWLSALGSAFQLRFNYLGNVDDIGMAIDVYKKAIGLTPEGHSFKASLNERHDDIENAIDFLNQALDLTPDSHPGKPSQLINLGNVLQARVEHSGKLDDMETVIVLVNKAVDLTPDGHASKAFLLDHLGTILNAQFDRFRKMGNIDSAISYIKKQWILLQMVILPNQHVNDIETAIFVHQKAVDLTPEGCVDKPSYLSNLGKAFREKFQYLGQIDDIEKAISYSQKAVDSSQHGDTQKALMLNHLGNAFQLRFVHFGNLEDIENAIVTYQKAMDLTSDNHFTKPSILSDFGGALHARFDRMGELHDLERTIIMQQKAVDLTPIGHAQRSGWLNNLGTSIQEQYERLGNLADLERAIVAMNEAVDLTPDDHVQKPAQLNNLGGAFKLRFDHLGELGDIEKAIVSRQKAVDLTPIGHTAKPLHLNNLGSALQSRFERLGELHDIEKAIVVHRRPLISHPKSMLPHRMFAAQLPQIAQRNILMWLHNLGNAFQSQFYHRGNIEDLKNAIIVNQEAVALIPGDHASKPEYLNSLAIAYWIRSDRLASLDDIESAISLMEKATDLTPDGHAIKPSYLYNLGSFYQSRFGLLGELYDMEKAIGYTIRALDLTPSDHVDKPKLLSNLGKAFWEQFKRLNEAHDIERAILLGQQAVDLTPDNDPEKAARLGNLGAALLSKFHSFENLDDLERAIITDQKVVDITPGGHATKHTSWNNLGAAYAARFRCLGNSKDLESAINAYQQAVDTTPPGHAAKPTRLNNLGVSFMSQFKLTKIQDDIDKAIVIIQEGVCLTPDGHAKKPTWLSSLADAFYTRFEHFQDKNDLHFALSFYKNACFQTSGHPFVQLKAAESWAKIEVSLESAISAFKRFIELIPKVVWLGQKIHNRYNQLPFIGKGISSAVAIAIEKGDFCLAVEWLEEGRSVVWGQILQLRTPLDDLALKHPEQARDLRLISQSLQIAGTSQSRFQNETQEFLNPTLEEEAQAHRQLAGRYDVLVEEIRILDGFEGFLKPKKFTELASASAYSPVIILNSTNTRSDALMLYSSGKIRHIPLPTLDFYDLKLLQSGVQSFSRGISHGRTGERLGIKGNHKTSLESVLAKLWSKIVHPILLHIKEVCPTDSQNSLPHITWCTTGAFSFLPLHAAGIYQSPNPKEIMNISDFVVSSYITKLSDLLRVPSSMKHPWSGYYGKFEQYKYAKDRTKGFNGLPETITEIQKIEIHIPDSQLCHLTDNQATVDAVLKHMHSHNWVHLACHGIQDIENPLESAFVLHDGKLKIERLMAESLEGVELAVLSACQTATGDQKLPEEALHLAAGMLSVGYLSVIATMWAITDEDGPVIADRLYEHLIHQATSKSRRISPAYALHEAVKHLKGKIHKENFERWVPFVHFGI